MRATPFIRNRWYLLALLGVIALLGAAIPALAQPPGDAGASGLARAVAAQERSTPGLLNISGVVGTAVGIGKGSAPVIKVYTSDADTGPIPASVGGFPVIVEDVGSITAQPSACGGPPWQRPAGCDGGVDRTARFDRPVPIGVSTGHPDITAGTIGARVVDDQGHYYALSNNHVYANENLASTGDNVLQPGSYDGGTDPADAIGTLSAFQPINFDGVTANRVDAAIALTTTSNLAAATPSDGYGTPSSTTVNASLGANVIKYGRTTGQTSGYIDGINATVNVGYDSGTALYTGQIIVRGDSGSFSQGGDSGSLIVTADGHHPVALLFAGNNSITVGNPIDEVLAALGVHFEGGSSPTTTTTTTTTSSTTTTTTSTTTTTTTTPPPQGDVTVAGISPAEVTAGSTLQNATIDGTGFALNATVTFSGGSGPTPIAESVEVVNDTTITLNVVTKSGGPPRDRQWSITVTNTDGSSGTAVDALLVHP